MNKNYKNKLRANIYQGVRFRSSSLLFYGLLFLMFFSSTGVVGQAPNYTFDSANSKDLDFFTVKVEDAANIQAKLNRLIIAVDINPSGEQFVLTFGNGIKKVGVNGDLVDFIPNQADRLSNALDLAINSDGKFFVATNESFRRFVRVYSSSGAYLSNETLGDGTYGYTANQFKGPTGLAFDKDDNLYVADHYLGNLNPSEPSAIKIYKKDLSGNYKNNLVNQFDNIGGILLNFPFRLAVNSQQQLYVSELGDDDVASVKVIQLDAGFNPIQIDEIGGLPDLIGSAGSIIIDKLDNIFILDFGDEINLPRLLNATDDPNEFANVFEIIKKGIQNNAFKINTYNPDNSFRSIITDGIDFPIDLTISNCGTLYVNNSIFDGKFDTLFGFPIPDITLDFDLEVYQRSAGYDTDKPILISCPENINADVDPGKSYATVTFNSPTATDNCSTPTVLQTKGPVSGSQFQAGSNTEIEFTATDVSGNTQTCSFTVTITESSDSEKPVFTSCPENIPKNIDSGKCGAVVAFSTPTATDNSGEAPTITRVDNNLSLISGSLFPVGSTQITYRARDTAGNFSECSFTIIVTDNEKPVVSCPTSISETVAFGTTGKIINYTAPSFTDNCSVANIIQTAGEPSGSEFPLGITTNSFLVTDASGNTQTCSFTVTIAESSDSEKPVFTPCPGNIPKNIDSGKCGSVVTFSTPTATDNSGEAPTITRVDNNLSLISGSLFPVGSTQITYRATDTAGNFSECSLKIIVTDNEKPVVSCPTSISETVALGITGKTINYTAPSFTDNCPGAYIIQTAGQSSGSEFPLGITTNSFLVTDASGNTQNCSFTVTIAESSDSEKPVFTPCPGNIPKNIDSGKCGVVVTFSTPTATDNSGEAPTITRVDNNLSLISGSLFPVGSTQITYRATDTAGNFSECSFTIIVTDNEKPTFECPENITANFEASEGYSVPDYSTLFPAIDNCESNLIYTQNPSANTVIKEAGDYQITLSAEDTTGNVGTCSFVLMLTKSNTFLLSCNGFFNLEADENCKFIMPDLSSEYSFQPSAASVSQSIPVGQEINADTNVTITATYNGEVQTCVIKVTLVDYEYPEIQNCPQAQTITLGNNEFYTIPDFTLIASATDNCEIQSFSQNLAVGSQINQSEQVILSATDNFGNTTTCAFNLIINNTNPVNQSPVANNNTFNTNEETLLSVPALGVLANDTDADNDVLTAILQTSTSNGNLTLNSDGSFTYTPNTGFTSEDSFTYVANDGTENSNIATVTINVNPVDATNNAPVSIDDIYSTVQNVSLTVPATNGVLSNDSDAEGDQLNASLITDVSFGTLTLNPDGSFVYIPFADFSGADFFTYYSTDGNLDSNLATARIEVIGVSDNTVTCKEAISLELDVNGNASLNAGELFTTRPSDLQFSISKDTFTCADLGENLITLSYNNSQVQGSCEINITIIDAMAPIVKVKPLTIALNNFGSVTITPEMLDDGTTDNCSDLSFSLSKSTFGCKEIGENTIIFTATDSSGNVSSESVIILVTGNCEIVPEPGVEYVFIYPNPTSGPFQFATPNGVTIERVEAFDFRGRMILFKDFSAGELQYAMDLSGVQNAVYILKLFTSEGISIIRVIIN